VPVGHVTNGIHVPSWDSAVADVLWTEACGKSRWSGTLDSVEEDLRQLSDEKLWSFRAVGRRQLIEFLRQQLVRQHRGRGAAHKVIRAVKEVFDPDVLTLGFARRFAEYKRPNLLLHDPQRLVGLLCNRDRPVQLVIAGKAHPRDLVGKQMLHQWQDFLESNGMHEHVVFVEDYDLGIAEKLTQGVDVWINTPRRPWEASGTSGMKVLVNGGLNLSELDGWWLEAYAPELGWALGDGREHDDINAWDAVEAEQLYQLLEREVIPCFYQRDVSGLPREWVGRMRESMCCLTSRFSTNRMMREYTEDYYMPLAEAYQHRITGAASELEDWCQQLTQHWQHIHFGSVTTSQTETGTRFEVQLYLGELPPEAVCVELYADPTEGGEPFCQSLERGLLLTGAANAYVYQGTVPADRPASDYTPRLVAAHDEAIVPLEANFILWYR